MNEAMSAKTTREWLVEFEAASIPCGPVNTIEQVAADPQIAARDMIVEVRHPESGNFRVVNSPVKLSRTPAQVERGAPDLGEDTEKILAEVLGFSQAKISELKEQKVI
jgi:crotonobetainyl-CoA:carnitine CoA-transferase CaiB-like acyl-CoA transferase